MRADRLVAIVLLLQRRGQATVAEIADELEIAPRTARRDLEALAIAGVPVYSVAGRGGGWRLAGGGRIDLSGLSAGEAQALFLVAGPAATATPALKTALRKLVRALPDAQRDAAERASAAMLVDERAWGGRVSGKPAPPLLDEVRQAVIDERQLRLAYTARSGEASERVVEPLGVAAKSGSWYLVADTDRGLRTFRIDRITSLSETGLPANRPAGFDLAEAWALTTDRVEEMRTPVVAEVLADREAAARIAFMLGPRARTAASPDGRVAMELRGYHLRELAVDLAGFGDQVEVVSPPELRDDLARVGRELVRRYG